MLYCDSFVIAPKIVTYTTQVKQKKKVNCTPWRRRGSGGIDPPFLALAQDSGQWSVIFVKKIIKWLQCRRKILYSQDILLVRIFYSMYKICSCFQTPRFTALSPDMFHIPTYGPIQRPGTNKCLWSKAFVTFHVMLCSCALQQAKLAWKTNQQWRSVLNENIDQSAVLSTSYYLEQ